MPRHQIGGDSIDPREHMPQLPHGVLRVALARHPALQAVGSRARNVGYVGGLQLGAEVKRLVVQTLIDNGGIEPEALHEFERGSQVVGEKRSRPFLVKGFLKLRRGDERAFNDEDVFAVEHSVHDGYPGPNREQ